MALRIITTQGIPAVDNYKKNFANIILVYARFFIGYWILTRAGFLSGPLFWSADTNPQGHICTTKISSLISSIRYCYVTCLNGGIVCNLRQLFRL